MNSSIPPIDTDDPTQTDTPTERETDGASSLLSATTKESVVTAQSGSSREVFKMALPLMVSFLSMSLMGIVDTYIMGKVGTAEQGGVGLGATVYWTLISFFTGSLTVVSTFVSQSYGAGQHDSLKQWVSTALLCAVPMSLLAWMLIPGLPLAVELLGTTKEVQPTVQGYMNVRIWGTPFILIDFILAGFLRGLGDTKTPMKISLLANVVNLILDIILVFGLGPIPALGARGAALATVIGSALSCACYVSFYLGSTTHRRFGTRRFAWPGMDPVKRFLRVGLPIGVSWVIESVSWSMMTVYIASIAPEGLAAHVIVFQVLHVSFLPAVALSIATSTLVGQYIGASRVDLAKRSASKSILWNIFFMGIGALIFLWKGGWIVSRFNPDPAVVTLGSTLFVIAAAFQVFDALNITAGSVLRGAGDTRFPMLVQMGCAGFVFIPLVFVFGQVLEGGVVGAWLAALTFTILVGSLLLGRYLQGAWQKVRVV